MVVKKTLVAFTCKQLANLNKHLYKLLLIHQLVVGDSLTAYKLLCDSSWSEIFCKMFALAHQMCS
jgi:hypothetical protein